jgi:phage shock protein A
MNLSQLENSIQKLQSVVSKINSLVEEMQASENRLNQSWSSDSNDKTSLIAKIRNDINGIQSVNGQVSHLAQSVSNFKSAYEREAQRY